MRYFSWRSSRTRFRRETHACGIHPANSPRWLQTPCALRLRELNQPSQPLTPSVALWALPRDLRISRSPPPTGFRQPAITHAARTLNDATRLEETPPASPGCLPSARCSTLRPSEAFRVPSYVRAKVLAPLLPATLDPPRQSRGLACRATPFDLGSPRDSPRPRGQDASYRPLQPTHDTSTR